MSRELCIEVKLWCKINFIVENEMILKEVLSPNIGRVIDS